MRVRGAAIGLVTALSVAAAGVVPVERAAAAPTVVPAGAVVVGEVHYHPPVDGTEFVELANATSSPIDLGGACFTEGISGCFPTPTVLPAEGFVVAAEEPASYAAAFPAAPTPALDYGGSLSNGGERITLVLAGDQLDSVAYDDGDPWPTAPDGGGPSLELTDLGADNDAPGPWLASLGAPTPGARNSVDGLGPAPVVHDVVVGQPAAGVATPLRAEIDGLGGADAMVEVVVDFGAPIEVALRDDGLDGDAVAGDGRFQANLPAQGAGTLVRWRIRIGDPVRTWYPEPVGLRRFEGFVVERPEVATALPILDWYLSPADLQWLADNRASRDYVPAVLVVGDRVIDGAEVRNQGGFTTSFSPKGNYKFKLPGDEVVEAPFFDGPVDEFVVDADFEDPTAALGPLAWTMFAEASAPLRRHATARVERNGTFLGVYQLYQEYDGTWFDQLPFEASSFSEGTSGEAFLVDEGDPDALQARWELAEGDEDDMPELVAALDRRAGPARVDAILDHFDQSALIDQLALGALIQHHDSSAGNMDLVRSADDGRWHHVPNDLDLALGLRGRTRWGDLIPRMALPTFAELYGDGDTWAKVARRIRTLHDRWFADDALVDQVAASTSAMAGDLAEDRAAWDLGLPSPEVGVEDFADFVAFQRALVARWTDDGMLPAPQPAAATARLSEVAAVGGGGDFVELANPDRTTSVDLSGWSLTGAVAATLPGGTVIEPDGRLVVPLSPRAMAALERGVPVAGRLGAPVPAGGGTIELRDPDGAVRDQVTWSSGGSWPSAAGSGRSIEARTLDAARATGAGWALSPQAGGTPGEAGASASGLAVTVSTLKPIVSIDAPVEVRIVVANRGPQARTAVEVDGPVDACDRELGTLAAGAATVVRCTLPASSQVGASPLATTVRAQEEPLGVVDAPVLGRGPIDPDLEAPGWGTVRLTDGVAQLDVEAPGFEVEPTKHEPWRLEVFREPVGGSAHAASTIDPFAEVATVPVSMRSRLRLVTRTQGGNVVLSGATPPVTAHASAAWPFASSGALVDRWYAELAGRPPTAGERQLWVGAIAAGFPPVAIAEHLLGQPRWRSQVAPIVRLYLAHFGRLPDSGGLRYWIGRRWAGATLDRLSRQFAASSEFERRYQGLDAQEVVEAMYRNVFERDADPSGRDYWTRRIEGGYPVAAMVVSFSESSEGRRLKHADVEATIAWFAFHRSVAPAAWHVEAAAWIGAGGDLGTLLESARTDPAYAQVAG